MWLRALSTRIIAALAALILAFGVTTVLIVTYMDEVGTEIAVVRTGYLQLALETKELARKQEDLHEYLSNELEAETSPRRVQRQVRASRKARDESLARLEATLREIGPVPSRHARRLGDARRHLDGVTSAVRALDAAYEPLLAAPPVGPGLDPTSPPTKAAFEALGQVRSNERSIRNAANDFAAMQERVVKSTAKNLEQNEERLRAFTIYLSVIAAIAGILITIWVTFSLRPLRRLRDGARRIAAGDYASRVDERGPSEVADLAREFNSMGRAIEERERDRVRSERLAAVGKMAAMITHEVRNPLSSIALNTELLEDELGQGDTAEARALCASITREVDRLTAITEEYLAFARVPKPKLSTESINAVVDELTRFIGEDLGARGVMLEVELAPDLPAAQIDPAQLRQCLLNLIRNATEAVIGRPTPTVRVSTSHAAGQARITVADNGPGISPETRAQLFDPLFSTKQGGTGLGLALTQQIVRDHGGTIDVNGTLGEGAQFSIVLPTATA